MKRTLSRLLSCLLLCAVLCTLLPVPASAAGFKDVPADHWAAASINRAVELGLFNGKSASRFGLGEGMTRSAFVRVLCRLFQWELETPEEGSFADNQDPTAGYYSVVETAYRHGAIPGHSEYFRPYDAITREELAVMLVRALGYGTIAGLTQELSLPFTDVTTNAGYISMAYQLGIISGYSGGFFRPDDIATREQVAVILVRVYDKYYGAAPSLCGLVKEAGTLPDSEAYTVLAADGARLVGGKLTAASLSGSQLDKVRQEIQASGRKALLAVSGGDTALGGETADTAGRIAGEVTDDGWDGVLLDLAKLPKEEQAGLTALVQALDKALGDKLLYVVAEAPAWQGESYGGYDYGALSKTADRLILRAASYEKRSGSFPTAPLEPLEEVYYALAELKKTVSKDKLSLWLTTTGSQWSGGSSAGSCTAEEIAELLESAGTEDYYSARYEAAYLIRDGFGTRKVVWYQDGRSAASRARLADFFGVGSFCLSDAGSAADYPAGSVLSGLLG